jgi:MoxR-like ATPase
VLVDYPSNEDEAAVVARVIGGEPSVRKVLELEDLLRFRETVRSVAVERRDMAYAVELADATRHPERHGLGDLAGQIEVGASPRGPIGLVQASQALALLRGRGYVTARDIRDVAPDVLRHRLVLTYEAHADGVTADAILDRVLETVEAPGLREEHAA